MKKLSLVPASILVLLASSGTALAQSMSIIGTSENIQLSEIIKKGLAYAIMIAGFLSVIFIFFGGISFILSGGDEGKIKQAVSTIRYAIIGLIITILSVVIVATVGRALLNFDIVQYINLNEIIKIIQGLTSSGTTGTTGSLD